MVKPMPVSLSRIEREYVIQTLENVLPPLSLLIHETLYTIPEKTYSLTSGIVSLPQSFLGLSSGAPVRVFFQHRQRGMFFSSTLSSTASECLEFEIPSALCKDDANYSIDQTSKTKMIIQGLSYESIAITSCPLDYILVNPDICLQRLENMQKIALKAGIEQGCSLLSYRLFDYLDGFRQENMRELPDLQSGHFFYIDHQYVLVSVQHVKKTALGKGAVFPMSIVYDKRLISVDSVLCGNVPVNKSVTVLCVDISNAQEEDKRFLYEKLYKVKYTG